MSSPTVTGSCVCEKITYKVTGIPLTNIICHCDTCRKTTGSVFMANSMYAKENFKIITGEDVIKVYEDRPPGSKNTLYRHFCSNCSSPIYTFIRGTPEQEGFLTVTSGTMNLGKSQWRPTMEVFCSRRREYIHSFEGAEQRDTM